MLAVAGLPTLRAGRDLTRRSLEATLQLQAEAAEKLGPGRAHPCGGRRRVKDRARRASVTAAGRVGLTRRSLRCPRYGLTAYATDERLGLGGFLNP